MSMKENGTGATEQRLIDANALKEQIIKEIHHYWNNGDGGYYLAEDVIPDIDNAHTVDAVEVVRCKACQHWQKRHETRGICLKHIAIVTFTTPDFYCACGERRTDHV